MRVMFVAAPIRVHALPLVPLAWAVRAAGHEVLVATAGGGAAVADGGLPVVDVAPGIDVRSSFQPLFRRHAGLEDPRDATPAETATIAEVFGDINDRMADGAVAAGVRWRPRLVVHDTSAAVGALVAARLGVPAVRHEIYPEGSRGFTGRILAHLAGTAARCGTELPAAGPMIDTIPPSLASGDRHGWSMRCVPYSSGGRVPRWLLAEPDRPRIAVTMGTAWGTAGPLRRIVRAAADVDAEFLLALGDTGPPGALPPNVRPLGWMPLSELLPRCSGVIHHGGGGTTFAALAAGVPQLVFPGGIAHFAGARAVCDRGAGLLRGPDDIDADLLRRLLDDDAVRSAAADVGKEVAAMPAPADLVAPLTALAS